MRQQNRSPPPLGFTEASSRTPSTRCPRHSHWRPEPRESASPSRIGPYCLGRVYPRLLEICAFGRFSRAKIDRKEFLCQEIKAQQRHPSDSCQQSGLHPSRNSWLTQRTVHSIISVAQGGMAAGSFVLPIAMLGHAYLRRRQSTISDRRRRSGGSVRRAKSAPTRLAWKCPSSGFWKYLGSNGVEMFCSSKRGLQPVMLRIV